MELSKNSVKINVFCGQENKKRTLVASFVNVGGELTSKYQRCYINGKSQININVSSLCFFLAYEAGIITGWLDWFSLGSS